MKRTSLLSTALLLAASMWGGNALAVNISLDPTDIGPVTSGDVIKVDIVASDLGTEVITAYDMAVAYDDTLLTLDMIAYSDVLGTACENTDASADCEAFYDMGNVDGPGFADPNLFSILDLATLAGLQGGGDFILASLVFTANADADLTSFAFNWRGINDVKCNDTQRPQDLDYICSPTGEPGIPEPGTVLLLSLGFLALGLARRKPVLRSHG